MIGTGIRLTACAVVACAISSCETPVIVDPEWAERPSAEAMKEQYPTFASMAGLSGRALMVCRSVPDGQLADCRVEASAPKGVGFERAALSLAGQFRLSPRTVDGTASGADVRFVIRFQTPPVETIAPYTGPAALPAAVAAVREGIRPTARKHRRGILEQDLQVDADRQVAVRDIIEQALKATDDEYVRAQALAQVRALTPSQAIDVTDGYRPRGHLPSIAEIEAKGPELRIVDARTSAWMRSAYCVAYTCSMALPGDPARARDAGQHPLSP